MLADQVLAHAKIPMSQLTNEKCIAGISLVHVWVNINRIGMRNIRKCLDSTECF